MKLRELWNKDVKGALLGLLCLLLMLGVVFVATGCAYWHEHPTEVRAWAAFEVGKPVVGRSPTGNILVTQPLPYYFEASYNHVSSLPDYYDKATVDQFGIGVCIKVPLNRC